MVSVSYSAMNIYTERPRAYYLHYLLRLRPKLHPSPFFVGTIIDESLNVLLSADGDRLQKAKDKLIELMTSPFKIATGMVDPKTTKEISWYKSDDDRTFWTEDDTAMFERGEATPQWISWRRKGTMMLEAYEAQVMPHLQKVVSIQKEVGVLSDEGDTIRGFTDLKAIWQQDPTAENYNPELDKYNGKLILFDNKTAGTPYKADSVKLSEQLGTYANCDGIKSDAQGYIVIPKKFRKQKLPLVNIQILIDNVDDSVVEYVFEKYDKTIRGIKLGEFSCDIDACKKAKFGCPYINYCQTLSTEGLMYCSPSDYKGDTNGKKKESNNSKARKRNSKKG